MLIKKQKEQKKKKKIMFNNYIECLKEKKKILKKQQRFKSDAHNVHTEEINKVALSFEDDKRLIYYVNKNYYLKYQDSVNS